MRIKIIISMVFFFLGNVILAQEKPTEIAKKRDLIAIEEAKNGWWKEAMASHEDRVPWWREGKFGMFVHWGIYALPANDWKGRSLGGYSEHLMRREKITRAEYLKIAAAFNPINFDADKWIKTARDAGMRYFVITAKHHDGFAMYPSGFSQFTLEKTTEFKRDPMAELSSACRKYGIKFGFYYSHAFDWEHPDAPGNDWEFNNPGGDKNLYGGRRWYNEHPELVAKAAKYVDQKAIPQLNELIDKYHPDILWFDTPHKLPYSENLRILKAIWIKDKNIVVNGRITDSWPYGEWGDYKSTDDQPVEFSSKGADWEGIPTTNDSYGYSRADKNYKSVSFFVRLLIKAASRGGNLLMNIGPKGDGTIDAPDKNILGGIGKWMSKNGESIYGTGVSGLPLQNWGVSTAKANFIYLHVLQWPKNGRLIVGGLQSEIGKAYLLSSKNTLVANRLNQQDLMISLPKSVPDSISTVIVLELKGSAKTDRIRFVDANLSTQFLAYDAEQKGDPLKKTSGQKDSYYLYGWTNNNQEISWTFRTIEPGKFKLFADYIVDNQTGGSYLLAVDGVKTQHEVKQGKDGKGIRETIQIGEITLEPGLHTISMIPVEIKGKELMKILELNLRPLE